MTLRRALPEQFTVKSTSLSPCNKTSRICLLGNFANFLSSADFFLLQKSPFFIKLFRNTIRVSNSLDPDQARHFVGPDLDPKCLQSLSADDTSRQRITCKNIFHLISNHAFIFTFSKQAFNESLDFCNRS